MPVTLWIRAGHDESQEAQRFLRANGYRADAVRDIDTRPPTPADLATLGKALGSLVNACESKHPRWRELASGGAEELPQDQLADVLTRHHELLRVPILVTPRGAIAGFRERRWREFLDIGKTRA